MNIPEKIILNNPLNWILSWNEWITQFLNRYLPFLMISPLFCLFWTLFGQFLGTFPIRPVLIIPWLLNWIIFWIESPEFILNWIIFWIESWVKQYWIEYWMNHFLAKFKYWIESDWVSFTTSILGVCPDKSLWIQRFYTLQRHISTGCTFREVQYRLRETRHRAHRCLSTAAVNINFSIKY